MGTINTKLRFVNIDLERKNIRIQEQQSRSWLLNFISMLYLYSYNTAGTSGISLKDITNTTRTITGGDQARGDLCMVYPGGVARAHNLAMGNNQINSSGAIPAWKASIVVGSNNTPVSPTDYALANQILNGTATGRLLYGGAELYGLTISHPNGSFTIRRYFTNQSGGDVTIRECGIYTIGYYTENAQYSYCICRDIVSPDVVVADTEILCVEYTVQITV